MLEAPVDGPAMPVGWSVGPGAQSFAWHGTFGRARTSSTATPRHVQPLEAFNHDAHYPRPRTARSPPPHSYSSTASSSLLPGAASDTSAHELYHFVPGPPTHPSPHPLSVAPRTSTQHPPSPSTLGLRSPPAMQPPPHATLTRSSSRTLYNSPRNHYAPPAPAPMHHYPPAEPTLPSPSPSPRLSMRPPPPQPQLSLPSRPATSSHLAHPSSTPHYPPPSPRAGPPPHAAAPKPYHHPSPGYPPDPSPLRQSHTPTLNFPPHAHATYLPPPSPRFSIPEHEHDAPRRSPARAPLPHIPSRISTISPVSWVSSDGEPLLPPPAAPAPASPWQEGVAPTPRRRSSHFQSLMADLDSIAESVQRLKSTPTAPPPRTPPLSHTHPARTPRTHSAIYTAPPDIPHEGSGHHRHTQNSASLLSAWLEHPGEGGLPSSAEGDPPYAATTAHPRDHLHTAPQEGAPSDASAGGDASYYYGATPTHPRDLRYSTHQEGAPSASSAGGDASYYYGATPTHPRDLLHTAPQEGAPSASSAGGDAPYYYGATPTHPRDLLHTAPQEGAPSASKRHFQKLKTDLASALESLRRFKTLVTAPPPSDPGPAYGPPPTTPRLSPRAPHPHAATAPSPLAGDPHPHRLATPRAPAPHPLFAPAGSRRHTHTSLLAADGPPQSRAPPSTFARPRSPAAPPHPPGPSHTPRRPPSTQSWLPDEHPPLENPHATPHAAPSPRLRPRADSTSTSNRSRLAHTPRHEPHRMAPPATRTTSRNASIHSWLDSTPESPPRSHPQPHRAPSATLRPGAYGTATPQQSRSDSTPPHPPRPPTTRSSLSPLDFPSYTTPPAPPADPHLRRSASVRSWLAGSDTATGGTDLTPPGGHPTPHPSPAPSKHRRSASIRSWIGSDAATTANDGHRTPTPAAAPQLNSPPQLHGSDSSKSWIDTSSKPRRLSSFLSSISSSWLPLPPTQPAHPPPGSPDSHHSAFQDEFHSSIPLD